VPLCICIISYWHVVWCATWVEGLSNTGDFIQFSFIYSVSVDIHCYCCCYIPRIKFWILLQDLQFQLCTFKVVQYYARLLYYKYKWNVLYIKGNSDTWFSFEFSCASCNNVCKYHLSLNHTTLHRLQVLRIYWCSNSEGHNYWGLIAMLITLMYNVCTYTYCLLLSDSREIYMGQYLKLLLTYCTTTLSTIYGTEFAKRVFHTHPVYQLWWFITSD